MASVDLLAGTVMDTAASLLNDTAKTVYTYTAQLPYINLALQELQEEFELGGVSVTQNVSAIINMPAGATSIVFNGIGVPTLPSDFIEANQLWERQQNVNPFIPMTRKDYLPHYLEGVPIPQFLIWVWNKNHIEFLPATQSNDVKIDYVGNLFSPVTDQNSPINVINAETFLQFRTAGLMAEFIERNVGSANSLNAQAIMAMDRVTGISAKSKQQIMTRRRPFRAAYKRRGTWFT